MGNLSKGLTAGLLATVVLSLLMVMKAAIGVMPALDLPQMIAEMMGTPDTPLIGWVIHIMIGVVGYGIAIALLGRHLPGDSSVSHGVGLAIAGWLLMMVVLMPLAGVGVFAFDMGLLAPAMTFGLHLIFGAVLGWTYQRMQGISGGSDYAAAH